MIQCNQDKKQEKQGGYEMTIDNLDERTKKYFERIKENVGFLGMNAGWKSMQEILDEGAPGTVAKKAGEYAGFANSSNIEILTYEKDEKKRYCAQFSYQTDVDDYCIETLIFDRYPSRDSVVTIVNLNDLEFKFNFKGLNQTFWCWECGRESQWLDGEGNFLEKIQKVEEKYCGC